MTQATTEPMCLSIPKAAPILGFDEEIVKAWTRRAHDPLPVMGDVGPGKRPKVIMHLAPAWLERNAGNATGRE